jgi:mono/diheme cytochrome c family protein
MRFWLVIPVVGAALVCRAAADDVDFLRDVKPLLAARCAKCHGPEKQENGFRIDAGAALARGGDSGPAIVAGKPDESLLLQAVMGKSDTISRMPLKSEPLTDAEVDLLRRWIAAGASIPADDVVKPAGSQHWAFQLPTLRPLPDVRHAAWVANPIDAWILARLEREGLAPSPPAERPTLIRRLSLDLVGLPPSIDEVDAFIADQAPDAYERLVDRLLASPHYGERWGRHWLDLARYADSNGYTRDFGRQIWKYREWVIDAINRSEPFDQFTIEQIAGDMLPEPTQEQLVATGFHRNTLINEEGGTDQEQFRVEAVVDRVNTTGAVFLGLTVGCARCHSHKYDPLSQTEYYQLFALLNNCDEPTIEVPSRLQIEAGELARRDEIRGEIKQLEDEVEEQRPELEARQREWEATVTPEQRARLPGPVQVAFDMKFEARDAANKKTIEDHFRQLEVARQALPLLQQIYELREREPKIPTTMILRERTEPRETFVHKRGDFLDPGPKVTGDVPAVLPPLPMGEGRGEGGQAPNRLDFARWLVSADNPLTPRVVVNRDWQKFFGRGLVETEDDFGTQGTPPTHPELLDWLAIEFVGMSPKSKVQSPKSGNAVTLDFGLWTLDPGRRRWDVKRMHRRIVASSAYRQASRVRSDLAAVDPLNRLLGRQSRLRLDAEIVRDVALAASGLLTRRLGGPSVFPPQPEGVFDFTQDPKPWNAATGGDRYRRGMYTHFWRSSPYPMLLAFDAPGGNVACTRRIRSNTPLQSLTLANDQAFYECAQAMADRVLASGGRELASGGRQPPEDSAAVAVRVRHAFRLCLAREPTAAETGQLAALAAAELAATPDQPGAAWTRLCRVLLNLDETITRE